jgi:5-methylcytosine-specific restriction endonuclease McrA
MNPRPPATSEVALNPEVAEALGFILSVQNPRRRSISLKKRAAIMERDGNACFYCGSTKNLQVDHVVPLSGGGFDGEDNLVTCCQECNLDKRTMLTSTWQERKTRRKLNP